MWRECRLNLLEKISPIATLNVQNFVIALVFALTGLASAICSGGQLTARQEIQQAAQNGAAELNLSGRGLTSLPPEIGQLVSLTVLYVPHNHLTTLPAELGRLPNLIELDLGYNQFRQVPAQIEQFSSLERLLLNDNALQAVPPEVGRLSNLKGLSLRKNQLPAELGQLSHLDALDSSFA